MRKVLILTLNLMAVWVVVAAAATQLASLTSPAQGQAAVLAAPDNPAATLVVTSTADTGPGTLRQALTDANNGDTITFDPAVFPSGAPATIALQSVLPDITQGNLTIDGSSAGVIVDGNGQPTYGCFWISSDSNLIKALQIINCPGDGIRITDGAKYNTVADNVIGGNGGAGVAIVGSGTMSNTVTGNLIGTDAAGVVAMGNATGVRIDEDARYNVIGGDTAVERNIISGSNGFSVDDGVVLGGSYNTVIGNYIGTNISGTAAIPNGSAGVSLAGSYNTVGGGAAGEGNVISGNYIGVHAIGAQNAVVSGNYIGTDATGTAAIPNGTGLRFWNGAQNNVIGGNGAGEGNVISGNTGDGVQVYDTNTLYNTIARNSIYANGGMGIALTNGGNNSISGPTITSYDLATGSASGTTCANCTVELFSDDADEGQWFEGSTVADGSGNWSLNNSGAFTGPQLTATTTDTSGNTSAFSIAGYQVYLPAILNSPVPLASSPALDPIANTNGDGNYTVSWSAVSGATSYTLEEDDNAAFSSPTTAYNGSDTSQSITGKDVGTYYYRVKAANSLGSSGWSNVQSVDVTVTPPTCPQTGSWAGTTAQSYPISFSVTDTPSCQVESLQIQYRATCTGGTIVRIESLGSTSITNNSFSTSGVSGAFTSTTAASGAIIKSFTDQVAGFCSVSTTWTASYSP